MNRRNWTRKKKLCALGALKWDTTLMNVRKNYRRHQEVRGEFINKGDSSDKESMQDGHHESNDDNREDKGNKQDDSSEEEESSDDAYYLENEMFSDEDYEGF